jgi:hypothetical protein
MRYFEKWLHAALQTTNTAQLRETLVNKLNYQNCNKAFRRVDVLLQNGQLDAEFKH